jgi:hypothetical protein
VSGLRDWPERALIAWIEESASSGSRERPIYRYYLTRNRTLLAVRDRGGDKRLFALRIDDRAQRRVPAWVNPFSGVH